jgi:hypothetical protein
MHVVWIANEKQYNLVKPLAQQAKKMKSLRFSVICVNRVSNGLGQDLTASEVNAYLATHQIESLCFENQDDAVEWLKGSGPDFIFTSTPYDLYLPEKLQSKYLSKIATLCNLEYGATLTKSGSKWDFDNPFWANGEIAFIGDNASTISPWAIPIGNVKLENLALAASGRFSDFTTEDHTLNIGWRPRWTLDSESTFSKYIETILAFIESTDSKLYFFNHPLFERKLLNEPNGQVLHSRLFGERSSAASIQNQNQKRLFIPDDEYVDYISQCDVIVADAGTVIAEAHHMRIPTVYTGDVSDLNELGERIVYSGWRAETPDDLNNLLRTDWKSIKSGMKVEYNEGGKSTPSQRLFEILRVYGTLPRGSKRLGANFFNFIFR